MRTTGVYLGIVLASIIAMPQATHAVETTDNARTKFKREVTATRKIELAIKDARNKIIEENKAIKEDKGKIKEASKLADKAKGEQIKQDMLADIKRREAVVKGLKKNISDMKDRKNFLTYGDLTIPKRDENLK